MDPSAADHDPPSPRAASDEIGRQSDPLGLRLVVPEMDGPVYAVIGPGHRCYRQGLLAARWRWRYPARAQELAAALHADRDWPRERGEQSNREHRALTAAALADSGLDLGEVAHALRVQLDTARRLVKDGHALNAPGRDFAPYVEQVGEATQPAPTLAQSWIRADRSLVRFAENELRDGKRERI